jgi:hypothetical protein
MDGTIVEFTAKERRRRLLYIPAELMMNVLLFPQRDDNHLRWLTVDGVPDGVEIESVWWCENMDAFCFRLWHSSFDVVEVGAVIPQIHAQFGLRRMPLCKTCRDAEVKPEV